MQLLTVFPLPKLHEKPKRFVVHQTIFPERFFALCLTLNLDKTAAVDDWRAKKNKCKCKRSVRVYYIQARYARFQLKCPMPIALCAPSCECISRFALCLGFVCVVDWNMWKSVARSSWLLQRGPASGAYHAAWPADCPKSGPVYASCLRSKTRIKCWFSSQRWPLLTKDPVVVLHSDFAHPHAKFRRHTSRHFRGDR